MSLLANFLTFEQLVLCWAIILVAAILQIASGMGFGMLASPLIALVEPKLVPGSILVMGLFVAFVGAWQGRRDIDGLELKIGIWGRVIGSAVAVVILLYIDDIDAFLLIFGVLMLLAILMTAARFQVEFNSKSLGWLSVLSGLMGTFTAVGAPPMAIIYHNQPPSKIRPTLNAFFFAGSVIGLVSLAASGWLGFDDFIAAVLFLPAMLVGIFCAEPFKRLPSVWMSRLLLTISGIASVMLIIRALT